MSTIKVTNIQATGETATRAVSGVAAAWLDANTDATLNDSFNIASGLDNGTGDYTHTLTNAMSGIYYSQQCTTRSAELSAIRDVTKSATSISIQVFSRVDSYTKLNQVVCETVHGDLA